MDENVTMTTARVEQMLAGKKLPKVRKHVGPTPMPKFIQEQDKLRARSVGGTSTQEAVERIMAAPGTQAEWVEQLVAAGFDADDAAAHIRTTLWWAGKGLTVKTLSGGKRQLVRGGV